MAPNAGGVRGTIAYPEGNSMTNDVNPALSAAASMSVYQGITLDIAANNTRSGQRIVIVLRSRDATNIAWSMGQDFRSSSGIRLSPVNQSAVPISSLRVGNEMLTLIIAPGENGEASRFTVQLFLAADPRIRQFTLALTSDSDTMVHAVLPMREPTPLSGSPTIFDWNLS